jgi:ABC-type Fe3+/spermidine/putrescine transport system ATPase subunit
MATRIHLDQLTVDYGAGPVVDGLDLVVEPGTLVALLGPSGCGKSTTLRAVAGLLQPRSGDVRFDGTSVLHLPPERRPVAMVFQAPLLFPHMSIGDNVAFGLRMRGVGRLERRRLAEQALEQVRLPGAAAPSRRAVRRSGAAGLAGAGPGAPAAGAAARRAVQRSRRLVAR